MEVEQIEEEQFWAKEHVSTEELISRGGSQSTRGGARYNFNSRGALASRGNNQRGQFGSKVCFNCGESGPEAYQCKSMGYAYNPNSDCYSGFVE